jgi:hypothetical protein
VVLNGWRRLFVVTAAVWSLGVGLLTWRTWPAETQRYRPWEMDFEEAASLRGESLAQFIRSAYPWAYHDLTDDALEAAFKARYRSKGQPPVVSYYTVLAAELGGAESLSAEDNKLNPVGPETVLVVPGVGKVAFPGSMSHEEQESRAKDLSELREKNDEKLRTTNRIKQITAAKFAAALWLLPLAAMYGFGWAVAWIRRGFAAARVSK